MARTSFTSVDDYIKAQPADIRKVLARVRQVIRKALPDATEVISYQIPAYKLPEGAVVYFAGWKQHYSLYPASTRLVAAFKDELSKYAVSKGTIRFPLSEPVPVRLIERLAKFRAKETAGHANAQASAPKKRR
jgi:uncharacterized protein YdhG (YjbR/CyaY superfamily)